MVSHTRSQALAYTGTTVDLEGANVDAQLVFANNELSMAIAKTHADLRSIIKSSHSSDDANPW